MALQLPAHIWFVRSNGGSGSYPIRPEGWRVVWTFLAGMAASAIIAWLLTSFAPTWVWVTVFAAGAAASAWYFISTARSHTDYSMTYNDYVKDNKNA